MGERGLALQPRERKKSMSFNLVDAIEAQITPEQVERSAKMTGASLNMTRQAMCLGVLAIVAALIQRASSVEGASALREALRSPLRGVNLTSSLLGERADPLTEVVATESGIGRPAASAVIGALLPLVVTTLGREVASRNLDAVALSSLLLSQKPKLLSRPRFSSAIATAVGLETTPDGAPSKPPRSYGLARSRSTAIPLVLVLGAISLGAIFLAKRSTETRLPQEERAGAAPTSANERAGHATVTAAEVHLRRHFASEDVPERIALYDVTFAGATAKLASGDDALDRLAALMREHPTTRLRLEAHSDCAGSPRADTYLSTQRASVLREELVERGVERTRIEIAGRGQEDPALAKDQRVEAVIIAR